MCSKEKTNKQTNPTKITNSPVCWPDICKHRKVEDQRSSPRGRQAVTLTPTYQSLSVCLPGLNLAWRQHGFSLLLCAQSWAPNIPSSPCFSKGKAGRCFKNKLGPNEGCFKFFKGVRSIPGTMIPLWIFSWVLKTPSSRALCGNHFISWGSGQKGAIGHPEGGDMIEGTYRHPRPVPSHPCRCSRVLGSTLRDWPYSPCCLTETSPRKSLTPVWKSSLIIWRK